MKQTPDSNAGALAALHSPWTGVIIALLFIIIAVVAVVVIRRDKKKSGFCGGGGCGGGRERFGWADWAENTERENFATSGCSSDDVDDPLDGLEVYRQRWHRHHGGSSHFCGGGSHAGAAEAEADAATALREGSSPDAPGACSQKFSRAAQAELDALRVAAGL